MPAKKTEAINASASIALTWAKQKVETHGVKGLAPC
jgi:hypothetical protein